MSREQELRKLIWEHERMYEKRKNKLTVKTLIVLSICFYIAGIVFGMMQEPLDYLTGIIVAVIGAGIFMFVAILVMTPLMKLRESELTTLTRLKIEMENIEKGQPQ